MSDEIGNEAHLVRFIVVNMTNLICALAWAGEDAIKESYLQIKQARELLDAVVKRAETDAQNLESR